LDNEKTDSSIQMSDTVIPKSDKEKIQSIRGGGKNSEIPSLGQKAIDMMNAVGMGTTKQLAALDSLKTTTNLDVGQRTPAAIKAQNMISMATKGTSGFDRAYKSVARMGELPWKNITGLGLDRITTSATKASDLVPRFPHLESGHMKLDTFLPVGISRGVPWENIIGLGLDHMSISAINAMEHIKPVTFISPGLMRGMPWKSKSGFEWDFIKPGTFKAWDIVDSVHTRNTLHSLISMPLSDDHLRANLDFTNRLDKLHSNYDYSFVSVEDQDDKEKPLYLVSKNAAPVPVEELKEGFGLLDLLKGVTEAQMTDFVGHLLEYPMLALEHKVGKLIRNTIKGLAKKVHVAGSFYRCRTREEGTMPFTRYEMFAAPDGFSSQGRFNSTGKGYLYVSRKEETAILEMKQPAGTIYDVIEWGFDEQITMIDVTNKDLPLFRSCMFKASGQSKIKKEYLVSNFLSQCCQIEHIDACKYKSVLTPTVSNYVFFDYRKRWFNCVNQKSVTI
jgi:hypothetical protein